jgi:mRNA-degrading endonuclease toxin of MazEF toxin-antitoxin module
MSPAPGEVWLADLGMAAKTRPVLIVSRHHPDPPRALIIYVPLHPNYRNENLRAPVRSQSPLADNRVAVTQDDHARFPEFCFLRLDFGKAHDGQLVTWFAEVSGGAI